MKMQNKMYPLLVVLVLLIVERSTAFEPYNRKGSSGLGRTDYIYGTDRDDVNDKYDHADNGYSSQSSYGRNRYTPRGSSTNNYRTRSRWPSSYEDSSNSNDWSRFGYGHNGRLAPSAYDSEAYSTNGPQCYSLLDIQYPLFSDICGAVPQARYSLPNLFGHFERWQIAQVLTAILGPSTPTSANPSCTRSLRLLLCPLLFPPCPTRHEAPPVLPCQSFCRVVKNQCATPSLDLLPCDLLPPTSDLCPINPTPYSSLLSSFAQPLPLNGGLSQSALSSILAQSALSPSGLPPSALSSLFSPSAFSSPLPPSARSTSPFNFFNPDSYIADSLEPILVDFPPISFANDYRRASPFFPSTRSATVKV